MSRKTFSWHYAGRAFDYFDGEKIVHVVVETPQEHYRRWLREQAEGRHNDG